MCEVPFGRSCRILEENEVESSVRSDFARVLVLVVGRGKGGGRKRLRGKKGKEGSWVISDLCEIYVRFVRGPSSLCAICMCDGCMTFVRFLLVA